MNKPLTLQEVIRLAERSSSEELMQNQQAVEFSKNVEDTGKEILLAKEEMGQYVEDASAFLFAGVAQELARDADAESTTVLMLMLSNPDMFRLVLGYAFIYAVGLCATEELR